MWLDKHQEFASVFSYLWKCTAQKHFQVKKIKIKKLQNQFAECPLNNIREKSSSVSFSDIPPCIQTVSTSGPKNSRRYSGKSTLHLLGQLAKWAGKHQVIFDLGNPESHIGQPKTLSLEMWFICMEQVPVVGSYLITKIRLTNSEKLLFFLSPKISEELRHTSSAWDTHNSSYLGWTHSLICDDPLAMVRPKISLSHYKVL